MKRPRELDDRDRREYHRPHSKEPRLTGEIIKGLMLCNCGRKHRLEINTTTGEYQLYCLADTVAAHRPHDPLQGRRPEQEEDSLDAATIAFGMLLIAAFTLFVEYCLR